MDLYGKFTISYQAYVPAQFLSPVGYYHAGVLACVRVREAMR